MLIEKSDGFSHMRKVTTVCRRMARVLAAMALLTTVFTTSAWAGESSFDIPENDAELVSRQVQTGADAALSMVSAIDSVDLNAGSVVVTVNDATGPHDVTLDYGDLLEDKRAVGAGALAGSSVLLGVLSRLARLVRAVFGA